MKVTQHQVVGSGRTMGHFEVRGEKAGTPFGRLWIEDGGLSWSSDENDRYAGRSWESFARMMAEKGIRSPGPPRE